MIQATRVHTPDGRYYQIGDEQYPSVTTILSAISKPALSRWIEQQTIVQTIAAADAVYRSTLTQPPLSSTTFATAVQARLKLQPGKSRTLAMNIGTEAHALIEWRLRAMLGQHGPRPTVSDPAETAYVAWESWAIQHDLEPIWIEETVWSSRYRYAGTMDLLCKLGLKRENIVVTDIEGVVYTGRTVLMDPEKARYAVDTPARTLGEVMAGADVFLGLSAGGVLKPEMVACMAERPLILDRKSTRLNSSHSQQSRMPSSA